MVFEPHFYQRSPSFDPPETYQDPFVHSQGDQIMGKDYILFEIWERTFETSNNPRKKRRKFCTRETLTDATPRTMGKGQEIVLGISPSLVDWGLTANPSLRVKYL